MKRDKGFSFIELLVAMTITLIVVAGTLAMLDQGRRTSERVAMSSNTLQNLRAGMNYMVRDVLLAGTGLPLGGIPIPNGSGVPVNRPSPAATNYTFGVAPNFFTTVPVVTTGGNLGPNVMRPSDVLTVMYADNSITLGQNVINDLGANPPCAGILAPSGASVLFDVNCTNLGAGGISILPGDLIMFTNVQGYALAYVTSVAGQQLNFAAGDPYNINQRNDPGGTMKQIQDPIGSGNYPPTTAQRVIMITYYLDNTQAGNPRLMRQVNFRPRLPVAESIEDFQATYDFVDGQTNPTDLKDPCCGDSANQIQNVNLFLAGRSNYQFSQTGQFYRNNLATKVAPRSLVFFNRYN